MRKTGWLYPWLDLFMNVFIAVGILGIAYLVFVEAGIFTAIAMTALFVKTGPWVTVTVTQVEKPFDHSVIKPGTAENVNRHFRRFGPVN